MNFLNKLAYIDCACILYHLLGGLYAVRIINLPFLERSILQAIASHSVDTSISVQQKLLRHAKSTPPYPSVLSLRNT